jgi:hypothetical protein
MTDDVLTVEQVAALLQVSERTVAVLDIPSTGRRADRRYIRADVLEWLAAQPAETAGRSLRRDNVSVSLRWAILTRDGFRCVACGATSQDERLHVDHIIPASRGGPAKPDNLQVLCEPCNAGKKTDDTRVPR